MTLRQKLAGFVRTSLADGHTSQIDDETALLDGGIIDSMGLMQLVAFIEEQTGVRVPDEEVMPDNFQDIASMEAMVLRLQATAAGR
jgi:acyl carrier protein